MNIKYLGYFDIDNKNRSVVLSCVNKMKYIYGCFIRLGYNVEIISYANAKVGTTCKGQTQTLQDGGLLNIFLFACICQSFSGIYNIAMRVGYYFMVPIVLLLPNLLGKNDSSKKLSIVKIVVLICFVVYGLYSRYTSSAGLYPYIFFWR